MIVASIDIGSNTALLLIADVDLINKSLFTLVDKLSMPRISKGLAVGSKISDENLLRLYTVLDEYSQIIKSHDCDCVYVSATNAFRIAANSAEIIQEIKRVFNLNLEIIDGETEALYSYFGATSLNKKNEECFVIDIGGGSTEIISGIGLKINYRKSLPLGVVSLSEKYFTVQPPNATEIEMVREEISSILSDKLPRDSNSALTIAVAGTPTTLSAIKMGLKEFDADKIEGSVLRKDDIDKLIIQISHMSTEELLNDFGDVLKGREDLILTGTIILKQIMDKQNIREVKVSTRGIRHGAIMSKLFRTTD